MWSTQNYNNTSPHKLTSANPNYRKISILPIFTTIQGYSTTGGSGQHIHAHADTGKDKRFGTEGATCTLSTCSSSSSTCESVGKCDPNPHICTSKRTQFHFRHDIPNTNAYKTTHIMCPQDTCGPHVHVHASCNMHNFTDTYGKNHTMHVHVASTCMHSTCTCLASSSRSKSERLR